MQKTKDEIDPEHNGALDTALATKKNSSSFL